MPEVLSYGITFWTPDTFKRAEEWSVGLSNWLFFFVKAMKETTKNQAETTKNQAEITEEPDNVFRPDERYIYNYWDGEKMVRADPMVLWGKFMTVWPELSVDIKLAFSNHSDSFKGRENITIKGRQIFSLKETGEGGLSGEQIMNLMDHFIKYCNHLKKNTSNSAISARETSPPSETSVEEE